MNAIFGLAWSIAFYPLIGLAIFIVWCLLGLLAMWCLSRWCRRQDRLNAAAGQADADGYESARAMLDGPVWRPEDLAYLDHGTEMPR